MFGSTVLEVAAGLGLTFLFVSLICSALREGIEVLTRTRAGDLERGLRELLDDPDGSTLAREVFDHPLIFALFRGSYDPTKLRPCAGDLAMPLAARRRLPSYIPAGCFAAAVLDLVARGPAALRPYQVEGPDALEPVSVAGLRVRLADFPHERVRRAVLTALDASGGDPEMVEARLEAWYEGAMERVSGWYRRRTHAILFGLGLALAAGLNIDPLAIAQRLYRDDLLRQAVAARAASADAPQLDGASLERLSQGFGALSLPIGWTPPPQKRACDPEGICPAGFDPLTLAGMGVGWLITAFAATMGAPFWFDLLGRYAVIRSTVKPREQSGQTAPRLRPVAAADPIPPPGKAEIFQSHAWVRGEADAGVL